MVLLLVCGNCMFAIIECHVRMLALFDTQRDGHVAFARTKQMFVVRGLSCTLFAKILETGIICRDDSFRDMYPKFIVTIIRNSQ